MKRFFAAVLAAVALSPISVTEAATPAIKVLPAKPLFITSLSGGSGDQITSFVSTPNSIVAVGTIESSTVELGPVGGASDGFVEAVNYQGGALWNLHLGDTGDEIATGIVKDGAAGYWAIGAATKPITGAATDSITAINPDAIPIEKASSPSSALTQIVLWRISASGKLVSTTNFDAQAIIYPKNIQATSGGFRISGDIFRTAKAELFTIDLTASGVFGAIEITPTPKIIKNIPPLVIQAGSSRYKSYLSTSAIKGIPSWRTKSPVEVIIGYSKLGSITSAHSLAGSVLRVLWQSGRGVIALTERNDGFAFTII